jgi:hypothetical protein
MATITARAPIGEQLLEAYERPPQFRREAIPKTPNPIPIPIPVFVGSRFFIWKQDPAVGELGIRTVFIPSLVHDGPTDTRIKTDLAGTTPVHANVNRDFLFVSGTPEFDCAHAFAVVRETLTMYQRIRGAAPLPWVWNTGGNTAPLTVFPRAGVTANAFYSRGQQALKFFSFTPSGQTQEVFTCRSLDIVAHETGHAVLDGLRPGWLGGGPPQTGGLHESFGDLTALFLACAQLDQVEAAIASSKANLHDKNLFLSALAEQFGSALGLPHGLRNADNDLKLSQVGNEVHAISQVFTGGIYDTLADIFVFEKNRQVGTKDPARVLLEVASNLAKLVLDALAAAPPVNATFADVVNQMLTISNGQGDPPIYRTFLRNRFTLREVVVSPTPLRALMEGRIDYTNANFLDGKDVLTMDAAKHASDRAPQDRSQCCGTMQRPEFTAGDLKKIQAGTGLTEDDLLASEAAGLRKSFK